MIFKSSEQLDTIIPDTEDGMEFGKIPDVLTEMPEETVREKGWTFREVLKEVMPSLKIAWPIALAGLLQFVVPIISLSFVGQLGETELASIGLGFAFSNIVGMSLVFGSSIACDTLCSQAFGAKNYPRVGVLVQRGSLFIGTLLLPIIGLWINSKNIFLALGQDHEVARLSQVFLTYYIPALVFTTAYVMLSKLISCQGIVLPLVFSCLGASVVNIVSNYVLINKVGLGIRGGAISSDIASFTMFAILLLIIKLKKYDKDVWQGWNLECLDRWGQYASIAVPSLFSLVTEWGTYELGGFIVGLVSKTDVAVHSIMASIFGLIFQVPYGLELALCIRVANYLGSGNVRRAKMVIRASLLLQVSLGISLGILVFCLREYTGRIFSNDRDVLALAAATFPISAVSIFFDGMQAVANGGIKGLGLLKYSFVTNLICIDFLALPIAITLTLKTQLHVKGYWIGLATAAVFQFVTFVSILLTIDWSFHCKKARRRAGIATSMLNIRGNRNEVQCNQMLDAKEDAGGNFSMAKQEAQEVELKNDGEDLNKTSETNLSFAGLGRGVIVSRIVLFAFCLALLVAGIILSILI